MRTVMVNPTKKKKAKPRGGGTAIVIRSNGGGMTTRANPRRPRKRARARTRTIVVQNPRRKRRRNPALAPMPMILNGRRRRRRRNPSMDLWGGLKTAGIGFGCAFGSYMLNRYLVGDLFHDNAKHWNSPENRRGVLLRAGVRMLLSMGASFLFPGQIGAGLNGAISYASIRELHSWWSHRDAIVTPDAPQPQLQESITPTHMNADLNGYDPYGYEADLNDLLDYAR